MSKVYIGNFKGPKGDKGEPGDRGPKGDPGSIENLDQAIARSPLMAETREEVSELADDVTTLNQNLTELKVLGFEVPSACPIQNVISGNTLTQKVGVIDLNTLTWSYSSGLFSADLTDAPQSYTIGLYCSKYTQVTSWSAISSTDKAICKGNNTKLYVHDSSYTDATAFKNVMKGVSLYYELATPITHSIADENKVTQINDSLADVGQQVMLGFQSGEGILTLSDNIDNYRQLIIYCTSAANGRIEGSFVISPTEFKKHNTVSLIVGVSAYTTARKYSYCIYVSNTSVNVQTNIGFRIDGVK